MSPTTATFNSNCSIARTHQSSLETRLQAAFEHARRLTTMYGSGSVEVAIAWEAVEELREAQRGQQTTAPSTFALYCAANPNAPECRFYEV